MTADSSQSKVSDFNFSIVGNEDIVWFEVSVQNSLSMKVVDSFEYVSDDILWKRRQNTLV